MTIISIINDNHAFIFQGDRYQPPRLDRNAQVLANPLDE